MDVCELCKLLGDGWEMCDDGEIRHACDSCAHSQADDDKKEDGGDPPTL